MTTTELGFMIKFCVGCNDMYRSGGLMKFMIAWKVKGELKKVLVEDDWQR